MTKPFAIAVAAILLLTAGAILIVRRVTEPVAPSSAGSVAAPAQAQPGDPGTPYQGGQPASGPTAAGTDPNGAPPRRPPAPVVQPEPPEEIERRPVSNRKLNRPTHSDRTEQPSRPRPSDD